MEQTMPLTGYQLTDSIMNADGNEEWGKLTSVFRKLSETITNSSLFFKEP
jgi:hypothetical protein